MGILGEYTSIEIIGISLSMLILVILVVLDYRRAWSCSKLLELCIIIVGAWSQSFR
jgi:hypothetical protein